MRTVVSINGVLCGESDAKVSVFDRGFLYGDGVFEVMRTIDGKPFHAEAHFERLATGASLLGIAPLSLEALRTELSKVLSKRSDVESFIRIVVTRGVGAFGVNPDGAGHPTRVIIASDLHRPPVDPITTVRLASVIAPVAGGDIDFSASKSTQYLRNILALRLAKEKGADDALLLDQNGNVFEAATSNVFVLRDGEVLTPPLSVGVLPGVTRSLVLRLCDDGGIPSREHGLTLADLEASDECFLTSSIRGLVAVTQIDGAVISDGAAGPVTKRLQAAYEGLEP